ncbi:MAG: hypothetical protein P8Z76_01000 [Alphaproteobacteria bacterium]
MLRQLVLFVMLAVIAAMPARAETVRPFDEGPQDKSFVAFRTSVLTALKARNYRALGRAAASDIFLGFGGHNGRAQFLRYLAGDKTMHGKLAPKLAADYRGHLEWVLRNGGGFTKNRRHFIAPYQNAYESRVPKCETKPRPKTRVCALDPHARGYIIGRDIPIYAAQSSRSKIVARLTYRLVELDKHVIKRLPDGRRVRQWSRVKLADGRRGWVRPIQYYAATGYRLRAAKRRGRWQITHFLAGD